MALSIQNELKKRLMNVQLGNLFVLFLLTLLSYPTPGNALAEKTINFVTFECRPYVGKDLPNQGFVHELIFEVCKRIGYQAQLSYYPLARSKMLVEEGLADALFPIFYDETLKDKFLFSDPFLGSALGLLKKKSFIVPTWKNSGNAADNVIDSLKKYRFGVVQGGAVPAHFDQTFLKKKDYVPNDLINIDKLYWGRNDFIIIDRYTVADLIVKKRPQYIGQLEFLSSPIETNPFRIAFSKKTKGTRQRQLDFNRGLKEVAEDGTMERIWNKHGFYRKETDEPGKRRLTIGTVNNADMLVMQELSYQFEKDHPDIDLVWRIMDENTLRLRLLSDIAIADGQFDIMTIGLPQIKIWAKNKWITPLQGLPKAYDKEDIIPSVLDNMSYDGQLYALPFYAESMMTFYRTDLFNKAGIEMPLRPTYEDIKNFAAAIHDPENQEYGICLRCKSGWGESMGLLIRLVNTYGGFFFDNQWNPAVNSPEWRKAISLYLELITKYGPPQPTLNGYNENLSLFAAGHCGIWIDATVSAGTLFDPNKSKVYDKLGFAPIPVALTPKGSNYMYVWALAISGTSNNKEAALQFITWATSKEYIKLVAEKKGLGAVPPGTRTSTYENTDYKAVAPFAEFVLDAIQTAQPDAVSLMPTPDSNIIFIGTPEYSAISDHIGWEIGRALEAKISLEEALLNSQEFAVRVMKH